MIKKIEASAIFYRASNLELHIGKKAKSATAIPVLT